MIIKLKNFILDIDVDRTREFYSRKDIVAATEECNCVSCQNFNMAIKTASDKVLEFLNSMGIDPHKPAEVYNVTGGLESDGCIWYNGWYHVCGSIISCPENEDSSYYLNQRYCPDPDFAFAVIPSSETAWVHEDFPLPVIQIEMDVRLPYVLKIPFES